MPSIDVSHSGPSTATTDVLHLRRGGTSVVLALTSPPSIVHWGEDLGDADAETLHVRLRDAGLPLYGAALRDDTADVRALPLHRCAIAIGSEGRGLTAQVLALCDRTVRIPMEAHCESLNAAMAAAVLLWEAYR